MKIRRVNEEHGMRYYDDRIGSWVYSFANINIKGNTLPTQKELSLRAKTLAYGQYKKEKRLYSKHQAKKKLLWIMSVVKARQFVVRIVAAHE